MQGQIACTLLRRQVYQLMKQLRCFRTHHLRAIVLRPQLLCGLAARKHRRAAG
jgi:hypothetical protein